MNPQEPNLLKSLDPPAGGLDGLRQRIDSRRQRRNLTAAVGVTVLALGWFSTVQEDAVPADGFGSDHPMARLANVATGSQVRILNGVALELPAEEGTRVFLVDVGG